MKKRFVFVTLLIAMVVLTQSVSLVRAVDTPLPPISGSDVDPTPMYRYDDLIAEGFAVSISADLPIPGGGPVTAIRIGGAVAGLPDPWDSVGYEFVPYERHAAES